jgi:hypothetical protein
MRVIFQREGREIVTVKMSAVPSVGDRVLIEREHWKVDSRFWGIDGRQSRVVVRLTDPLGTSG